MNKQYKESGGLWLAGIALVMIGYTMFSGDSVHETQNLIASFGFVIMFKLERISNGLSNYFNGIDVENTIKTKGGEKDV